MGTAHSEVEEELRRDLDVFDLPEGNCQMLWIWQ